MLQTAKHWKQPKNLIAIPNKPASPRQNGNCGFLHVALQVQEPRAANQSSMKLAAANSAEKEESADVKTKAGFYMRYCSARAQG